MQGNDIDYYRSRAEQERARADNGTDPMVANVHRTLAKLYEDRIGAGGVPILHLVTN